MAYGRIVQNLARAGGAGTTATVTHSINDATHCTFGVQDITVPGALRTWPAFWTSAKAANADTITDDTAAGACTMSFLAVAAHSLVDVGPVTAGITRTVTSPLATLINPGARSLHTGVPMLIANAAAASAAVTITHNLQTANVVVIAFPTSSPLVSTVGGNRPMVIVQNLGAATATTCQIQAQTQDAAVSNVGGNFTTTFDIMVLARTAAGGVVVNAPWSRVMRPHLLAGVPSDDYGAGARAAALRPDGTAVAASYGAIYTNIDDLAVGAGGTIYTHNLGATGLVIALFEQTIAVGAAYNTVGIVNNATSTTTATLLRGNELAGVTLDARVAFFRPYSPLMLTT